MKQTSKLIEWIKQIPIWAKTVSALIGVIIALVTFFLIFRDNFYVLAFVITLLLILAIICLGIYFIISRTKSQIIGGSGLPAFSTTTRIASGIVILIILILSGIYYISEGGKRAVEIALWGTRTPTPTQIPTLIPSPTLTPAPTLRPESEFLYYMIVLDASEKMKESFDGKTKWEAALESINVLLEGLNSDANYGLVVVGGSDADTSANPCKEPAALKAPFTSQKIINDQINQLQPGSGGSLYTAFALAKKQLESLPSNAIRTLIYITGSSDACEKRNEWKELEKLLQVPAPEEIGLYSEIIILDDDKGMKTQNIAEQISKLSEDVNVQAPQSNQALQQSNVTVVNNVAVYVEKRW